MSNDYFQFKQFRIEQDACAMKVTTDACIQGAWTPILPGVERVLDIGMGTGLLSLMLAQRNKQLLIDAIELDSNAVKQAAENIATSPWADRISVWEGDACNYAFPHKYDMVICNPPFFNNSLLGNAGQKNMARHTISLTQKYLLDILANNLAEGGYASILLPQPEYRLWNELITQNGWAEIARLNISHTQDAAVKRVVSLCSRKAINELREKSLVIKDGTNYTAAFTELLSPFYLNL